MNPFKTIEDQKKIIEDLTFELKYSKDKVKSANRINSLIETVNQFNDMLVSKYKTDAVNVLIYSLIYEWFMMFGVGSGKKIPLHYMVRTMDRDLSCHSDYKKKEVIALLEGNQLRTMIDNDKLKEWNGEYSDFDKLITRLANEFKQQLTWI